MNNPGVNTLYEFLVTVRDRSPASFSKICEAKNSGYGMVSRYIKFSLNFNLIEIVDEVPARGRYPSKLYGLTEDGQTFLTMFKDIETSEDESTNGE